MTKASTIDIQANDLMEKEVHPIVAQAGDLVIKSPEESVSAQHLIGRINQAKKRINEVLGPIKDATYKSWKTACSIVSDLEDPLDRAKATINGKVLEYNREIQRKHDEDVRIAQAKADERARKERETAEAKAKKLEEKGKTEQAEAVREAAENAPVIPVFQPPPAPVAANGTVFKKTWKGEVTDLKALCDSVSKGKAPLGLIEINQSAVNAFARGVRDTMPVPGIRFFEDTNMSVRGAA